MGKLSSGVYTKKFKEQTEYTATSSEIGENGKLVSTEHKAGRKIGVVKFLPMWKSLILGYAVKPIIFRVHF